MAKGRPVSRLARTLRALAFISAAGALLIVWNIFTSRRDVSLALGPQSDGQRAFFINAADRPDILTFYKNLTPRQRGRMAENMAHYDDAPLAKLAGTLLADFDPGARQALTRSMAIVAAAHPDAVADQLKLKGSFQILGVSRALTPLGLQAVAPVAKMLENGDARPNAIQFLVDTGSSSVPALLEQLDNKTKDVRVAAADGLAKLRATAAVVPLFRKYNTAASDEKFSYLTALSAIGDPRSEDLMAQALSNESLPTPQRSEAALGLGRINSDSAVQLLWKFAEDPDSAIANGALLALQLCRDKALSDSSRPTNLRLQVATGIQSPVADQVIREALEAPATRVAAAKAASGRPSLIADLARLLLGPTVVQDGELVDSIVVSLAATPGGEPTLRIAETRPELVGFVERRSKLKRGA